MEERENTIAWVVFLVLAFGALSFYSYSYMTSLDRMMEERYEEIKTRHQQTTLGMTEQEELDLLIGPLLIEEPAPPPPRYIDRVVQDWYDDHPFYTPGTLV